jgi:hypothetical protein
MKWRLPMIGTMNGVLSSAESGPNFSLNFQAVVR